MNSKIIKSGWPVAIAAIVSLLLLITILYWPTIQYLGSIWGNVSVGEYAHGFLVLAISLYLVNYNRAKLAKITPCPTYLALPLVFASVSLWLVAVLVDVEMLQAVALLFILLSVVWLVSGHQAIKVLAFPLLFIGFAIPVWFPLSPLLQNITADVVFWVIRVTGIPAFRQENLILIPSGTFSIEEACSGLRYLLAALTLGSLYAYLNYVTLLARVAVVVAVASTAVLANFLRVYVVIYLGYVTEMQHPLVSDHLMLGWYLFGGLIALLLFIDVRLYRPSVSGTGETNVEVSMIPCHKSRQQYLLISALCAVVLMVGPGIVYQQKNQQLAVISDVSFDLPANDWSVVKVSTNDWMPAYKGAVSRKTDYRVRDHNISVFIAYYPAQKQGVEVINDLNRITNNKSWMPKFAHPRIQHLAEHDVLEQVIHNNQNSKRLLWYWYNIGGQLTVNKYEAKLLQLLGFLRGEQQAYMIAVSMDTSGDVNLSREVLQTIISDMEVPLESLHVTE